MDKILSILKPKYLNSANYYSSDWRYKEDCEVFSNRKLCAEEIVCDFDKLPNFWYDFTRIMGFFNKHNFLFWAYRSGTQGLHFHFFVNKLSNKYQKRRLLEIIEQKIGIPIDKGPVMREWIRAEGSLHPTKGFKKELLYTNVNESAYLGRDFYTNYLNGNLAQKVFSVSTTGVPRRLKKDLENPKSIQFMEETIFQDGHKRIMFCLVSFYKKKLGRTELYNKIKDWCKYQSCFIPDSQILGSIRSSKGTVRENFRQKLLQELGFDSKNFETKVNVPIAKGSYEGF